MGRGREGEGEDGKGEGRGREGGWERGGRGVVEEDKIWEGGGEVEG